MTPRPRPAPRKTSTLDAIQQTRPFRSLGQEAFIALLLAAEALRNRINDLLARHGDLTAQQYNVLRILRGAGPDGLPTLSIVDRMIERAPGITRLLDRLEAKNLVRRLRSPEDRRQVLCQITGAGLDLLATLDGPVDSDEGTCFTAFTKAETRTFIDLLERLRNSVA